MNTRRVYSSPRTVPGLILWKYLAVNMSLPGVGCYGDYANILPVKIVARTVPGAAIGRTIELVIFVYINTLVVTTQIINTHVYHVRLTALRQVSVLIAPAHIPAGSTSLLMARRQI